MSSSIRAAVGVIYVRNMDSILLIERVKNPLDPWSGHLAFPGGRIEETDAGALHAVFREVEEEIGLVLEEESLVRELDAAYAGKTREHKVKVKPYYFEIGDLDEEELSPDKVEVERIVPLPLEQWNDARNHEYRKMHPDYDEMAGMHLDGNFLWGFTYHVLKSLNLG